jgi:hypothetical protein
MDPIVEAPVKGKRLALFGEMLKFYKYPDPGVLEEFTMGVSLVGEVPSTGMLPFKFTSALLTVDALRKQAEFRRAQLFEECKGSGDHEVDVEVWKQTLEERDKGWLTGPLEVSDIADDVPISKRFGLRQKYKTRLIDDYSESSINQTVLVSESPVLHTVDIACAAVAHWFGCCESLGVSKTLVARTFDLASAYRQVGLNAEGRSFEYIRVYNPETKQWAIFQDQVLPFGSVRSVHNFLRLARAVWWLGVVGCKLMIMWSSFFNDYIVLSQPELARSSELTASSLFKLLGWIFAEEGRKCLPFGQECEALGVVFNLVKSGEGVGLVYNTEYTGEEISAEIHRILEQGQISQIEAQKLRGRMQFAESQLYGRTGKRCIGALRDFACRRRTKILDREATFLKLFVSLLKADVPRQAFGEKKELVVIITDACYEREARHRVWSSRSACR